MKNGFEKRLLRSLVCVAAFLSAIPSAIASVINFSGDVSKSSLSRLVSQVAHASSNGDRNITIYLDSPGGDLKAALSTAPTLKRYGVNTMVRNDCSSSCTVLFAAGVRREASSGATFMFHGVGVSGAKGKGAHNRYVTEYANYWLAAVRSASPSLASYLDKHQILTRGEQEFTGGQLRRYGFVN